MEINSLVVGESGAVAVDVRVRVGAAPVDDTYLRHLPT